MHRAAGLAFAAGLALGFGLAAVAPAQGQPSPRARMAVGADVSFLPQAEAQGTIFADSAGPAEGLAILRAHGYNWTRLRLFNDPAALGGQRDFLSALLATVEVTPDRLGVGIFWWEPAVRGPLSRRGLFDDRCHAGAARGATR